MIYEVEFATGLRAIVEEEIRQCIGVDGHIIGSYRKDNLQFKFDGNQQELLKLRTVIAVYVLEQFDVQRPKALLGHQHFHRLIETIQSRLNLVDYHSLYINAAGSDSSVMMRIKAELAQALGLDAAEDEGDLLLRIRRTPKTNQGWDVLIRLTPRPLATRDYRVCNFEGALNASVAAALVRMTNPTPEDRFLNIACGSGTILIERHAHMPAKLLLGCDISSEALACAVDNSDSASIESSDFIHGDAIQLPFAPHSIDKLVADLPFGQLVGSHDENEWLYPAILSEAARVAMIGAGFVIITHEIRLMERVLSETNQWRLCESPLKITLSGLHPRIYLLERN